MPGKLLTSDEAFNLGFIGGEEALGDEGFDVISLILTSEDYNPNGQLLMIPCMIS